MATRRSLRQSTAISQKLTKLTEDLEDSQSNGDLIVKTETKLEQPENLNESTSATGKTQTRKPRAAKRKAAEQIEVIEEAHVEDVEDDEEEEEEDEEWLEEGEMEDDKMEQVLGVPMESLIKGEPVTEEDAKMMECPVCNLNVISFMMEEHKENCAGVDMMDDDSMSMSEVKEEIVGEMKETESELVLDDVVVPLENSEKLSCQNCSKVYARKADYVKHTARCTQPKVKYACMVCGKTYSRPDNLRFHLRSMHVDQNMPVKDTTVQCSECHKILKNKAVLTVHMRTHTGEKPYECEFCPKAFPTAGAYQKHKRTHTGERPFECEKCHRKFTAKEVLNRHLQTHAKVKPHACTYCHKTFVQAMQLRAHMFYHTGEFSYHCKQCDASFHKQCNLAMHVKFQHNGAKPLECEVCGKTFLTKNLLRRHLIIHSGRKDFKCATCSKCFISKPALKTHELTHRREEPRICYDCGRAFIRLDCLIRHMRVKHRDILDEMITTAESRKIRQHVLSAQGSMEKGTNWTDDMFTANLRKLLLILIDQHTLANFGWPDRPIDKILDALIIRCGSSPVVDDRMEYIDRLRENTKLLFTGIINDDALETLLNNNTVDEVVNFVLKLSDKGEDPLKLL